MYRDHPPQPQTHTVLNSTTIYLKVENIKKDRTYSCQCTSPVRDSCGLDLKAGYPPDHPKNISCGYMVMNDESGVLFCAWNKSRETHFRDSSVVWVRTIPRNHIGDAEIHNVLCKKTHELSVNFTVSRSVHLITVWIKSTNPLGSAVSSNISYNLSDIVMPSTPVLGPPKCSSRECIIKVNQTVRTQHMEIQYRSGKQTWTSYPHQSMQLSAVQYPSVSSLEPYRLYHFRVRSKFETGLWSQWSSEISSWTEEEAPSKELDVWYAESGSKSLTVYWKEANMSISRGRILGYKVRVHSSGLDSVIDVGRDVRNYTVQVCAGCEVTLWARNSKGLSPPATITAHHTKDTLAQYVDISVGNHSVAISWRKPEAALLPAGYVVEWYPVGLKMEELRWMRLSRDQTHAVLTDIKQFECYEGVLYGYYDNRTVTRTTFTGVAILESVPEVSPIVEEKVEGLRVEVMWRELPRAQWRGCITNYTIYVEKDRGNLSQSSVAASKRSHVMELSPAVYSLWMTASTARGEGPPCQKIKVYIQEETYLPLLLVSTAVFLLLLLLLCLYQCTSLKKLWACFQCLMLDVVPDPANSKWAKECTQEEGQINLRLQLSNPSIAGDEEEPILVDVEEVPKQNCDISRPTNVFSEVPPQIGLSPTTDGPTQLYPLSTYIKSFSQDSDSSDHTQTSMDTNTTVGYISSHGMGYMEEEEEEEDEDEMMGFLPSQNIFIDTLIFGGKLTLDAVKIEFSGDFFQDS
ncbi:interleukin-12 receptor subunit beta-2 isoform X2 [Echeneis naucrates]|nr:interleukin-12 receptor subunit beta-2-like isoform X2 [Echeneis naucrates]